MKDLLDNKIHSGNCKLKLAQFEGTAETHQAETFEEKFHIGNGRIKNGEVPDRLIFQSRQR